MLLVVFSTSYIVNGFGKERYGVLALTWVLLGYFTTFDLGLASAATKFVAEALGKKAHDEVPKLVWTAVLTQTLIGITAGVLLAVLVPLFTDKVFDIPPELRAEAKLTFYLTSLFIPLTFISGSFNGVLAAAQRFVAINVTKIPSQLSLYLAGIAAVFWGYGLVFVVSFILFARVVTLVAQIVICLRVIPGLSTVSVSKLFFKRMLSFGGWITISNSINPIMFYVDRFLISTMLGMTALTYYSVPFDLSARLWVISSSLTMTLFPAFSLLNAQKSQEQMGIFFIKSIKYLTLLSGSAACVLITFGHDIILLWVGADFAEHSTLVFQLLLFSTIFDFVGIISSSLLEGVGRPKVLALVKLIYLPIHVGLGALLVSKYGVVGGAWAIFSLRLAYSFLFACFALHAIKMPVSTFLHKLKSTYLSTFIFLIANLGIHLIHNEFFIRIPCAAILGVIYLVWIWLRLADSSERELVRGSLCSVRNQVNSLFTARVLLGGVKDEL